MNIHKIKYIPANDAKFSIIFGNKFGQLSGKSYFPMSEIASLNCFCTASGEFNITVTICSFINTRSSGCILFCNVSSS